MDDIVNNIITIIRDNADYYSYFLSEECTKAIAEDIADYVRDGK